MISFTRRFSNRGTDKMSKKKLIKKRSGHAHLSNKEHKAFTKCGRYFYQTVPVQKANLSFIKQTVTFKKRTVPCKKLTLPFIKRTEPNRATDEVARFRVFNLFYLVYPKSKLCIHCNLKKKCLYHMIKFTWLSEKLLIILSA